MSSQLEPLVKRWSDYFFPRLASYSLQYSILNPLQTSELDWFWSGHALISSARMYEDIFEGVLRISIEQCDTFKVKVICVRIVNVSVI